MILTDIINTKAGPLRGLVKKGYKEFLGVPFAKPPLGKLSYKHPLPIKKWEGVFEATKPAKNPMQSEGGFAVGDNDQDCLYLNIFVPDDLLAKAPVMVWIFGGSFAHGGAGSDGKGGVIYDLSYFAIQTKTIVVTINYRLNVFGFLNLSFASDKFDKNNGLYDQLEALRFIHENISSFGGDENNITVFGESAGGASALALLASPLSEGLIDKVIAQSPPVHSFWSEEESRKIAHRYMKLLGLKVEEADKLLDVPFDKQARAINKLGRMVKAKGELRCLFSPIIEDEILPSFPIESLQKRDKNLLIGRQTHECDIFIREYPKALMPLMRLVMPFKPLGSGKDIRDRMSDGMSEYLFNIPIEELASKYGGPCWQYEMDFVSKEFKASSHRSCHTIDVYVLFAFASCWCDPEDDDIKTVGKMMRRVWSDFAYGKLEMGQEKIFFK